MFVYLFFVFISLVSRVESRTSSSKGNSDDAFTGKIFNKKNWIIECSIVKGDMKKGFYHDIERLQEKMTIQDLVRLIPGRGLEVFTLFI